MMRARCAEAAVVILLLTFVPAGAQALQTAPPEQSRPRTQANPPSSDAAMGVSLKNIRKQVPEPSESMKASGDGLRYDFFIDVYGKRPAIDFFKDFDLSKGGGVRWGGVTHQEILNAVTPFPFHVYSGGIQVLGGKKKKDGGQ